MSHPGSRNTTRLVDMADVDMPEAAPPPPPHKAHSSLRTRQDRSRLSSVPLEDVVGSLSRSTSSTSSSVHNAEATNPASHTRESDTVRPRRSKVDLDDVASSIPTEMDLYGDTRRPRRRHHSSHRHKSQKKDHRRHTTKKTIVDVEVAYEGQNDDATADDDELLRKMRKKEKEFDSKIQEINNTFFSAGRQLVVRDDIIEHLQAELAKMRSQQHQRSQAEEQRYREKEKELVEQCERSVTQLRQENEELRGALQESNDRQAQQQRVMDQLMQQLTDADAKAREAQRQYERKLDTIRRKCQEQLQEFDSKFAAAQRRCAELEADRDGMQSVHAQSQAKLLGLQMELSKEKEGDSKAMKELWKEKERLRDEVDAVRLSMARLLQIMSEVPELREYLQWNELDSNFVFLGYPTRYFPGREAASGLVSHSDRVPSSRLGTGVEDGIYTGVATFQDSKNIWLNGRWVRQLQEIINAENMHLRLKKIKLYELEEAGQVSDSLPTSRDVLQCRRQERDYWVPYAIFQEAQHFKNKYYPKIPALSHFYPFLMRLNAIWYGKLQDRIRTLKKDLQASQQQLVAVKRSVPAAKGAGCGCQCHCDDTTGANGYSPYGANTSGVSAQRSRLRWQRQSGKASANVSFASDAALVSGGHTRVHMIGLSRAIAEWETQLEHLRREVRLNVTSQRSLQLFRVYNTLVQSCLVGLKDATARCEALEEEAAFAAEVGASLYKDSDCEYDSEDAATYEEGYPEKRRGRSGTASRGAQPKRRAERKVHRGRRRPHYHDQYRGGWDSDGDYEDRSSSREESDEDVAPLPPPPSASRPASRRHAQSKPAKAPSHDDGLRSWDLSRNTSAQVAEVQDEEAAIESLLCVVQHSSERVCGVADYLAERVQACCNDLEALMSTLKHVYIPSMLATNGPHGRGGNHAAAKSLSRNTSGQSHATGATSTATGGSPSSSASTSSSAPASAAQAPTVTEIQKQIRDILREQYGVGGQQHTTAHASNALGADPGTALANVVDSVFDFSREVRNEVLQAQKALQVIATEAMKEAEEA